MAEIIKMPANHKMKIVAYRPRAEVCRVHLSSRSNNADPWITAFNADIGQNVHTDIDTYNHITLQAVEIQFEAFVRTAQGEWGMLVTRYNYNDRVHFDCFTGPGQPANDPFLQVSFYPIRA